MVDQMKCCKDLGLRAAFVVELQADNNVKDDVKRRQYSLQFLTPESIVDSHWQKVLPSSAYQERIKFVVTDEAHCVTHW